MSGDAITQICEFLLSRLEQPIWGIYLYGSQASGDAAYNSDWDIAVLLPDKMDSTTLWQVAQGLASVLKQDVDLADLLSASTVLQYEITTTGKRIYTGNQDACQAFEAQVESAYLKLNEQRAEILRDIQQRGQVLS